MTLHVLVLHGPNLAARAEAELDPLLETAADALGATLLTTQANGEEGLLDALHAHAGEVDAVLVNPGVLAPTAHALAEGLKLVGLPAVEVLISKPRAPSVLSGSVKASFTGVEGFARALASLAGTTVAPKKKTAVAAPPPARVGKSIGRRAAPVVTGKVESKTTKSIGRRSVSGNLASGIGPATLREKITLRLKGKLDAASLAQWARTAYGSANDLESAMEDALLTLMSPAKADDSTLVALLAKLQS